MKIEGCLDDEQPVLETSKTENNDIKKSDEASKEEIIEDSPTMKRK